MNIETKQIDLETGNDEGQVKAVIATLGVLDKDRDITQPGFFGEQHVKMYWHHNLYGGIPIGKGKIEEVDGKAIFHGQFNLETTQGRDVHAAVKFDHENPPTLQQWSYGYAVLPGGATMKTDETNGEHRILHPRTVDGQNMPGAKFYEVSPVALDGAGEGTETLAVKSGMTFVQHAETAQKALEAFLDRAEAFTEVKGAVPADHKQRLTAIKAQAERAAYLLQRLLDGDIHTKDQLVDIASEYARFQQIEAQHVLATTRR